MKGSVLDQFHSLFKYINFNIFFKMRKVSLPFVRLQNIVVFLTTSCLFAQIILLVWYVKVQYVSQKTLLLHGISQEKHKNKTTSRTINSTYLFKKLKTLVDINPSTSNIFFIESKCATRKISEEEMKNQQQTGFVLSARQCCSVESAATMNPSRDIYILHTCPLNRETPEYAEQLLSLENVWLVQLNVTEFFQGTPVEALQFSGRIEQSLYPVEHSSDIMRLTVLWKYGGTYMDLDVVSLRPLDDLRTNFCGMESNKLIGNAVLNFEPQGYGHQVLTKALRYLQFNFNGEYWATNGPVLITKIILDECNATMTTVKNCTVFNVFDSSVLYPIPWVDYPRVFSLSPGIGEEMVERVKKTGYLAHMWNKLSKEHDIYVNSIQAYALLAAEFCPRMNNVVDGFN